MIQNCRTCLLESQNPSIYIYNTVSIDSETLQICKIISLCIGLEVSKFDHVTNFICEPCCDFFIIAYKFRKKCWGANSVLLKSAFNKLETKSSSDNVTIIEIEPVLKSEELELDILESVEGSSQSWEYQVEDVHFNFKIEGDVYDQIISKVEIVHDDFSDNNLIKNIPVDYDSAENEDNNGQSSNDVETDNDNSNKPKKEPWKISNLDKPHKCYLCNHRFKNMMFLQMHVSSFHKRPFRRSMVTFNCAICEASFTKYQLYSQHCKSHITGKYVCDHCGLTLKSKAIFVHHLRRHTGERPFKCDICDFSSAQQTGLIIHKRRHADERRYECKICNKKFFTSGSRNLHLTTHSSDTPFECTICGKKCKTQVNLKQHRNIHDIEKYFDCMYCDKKFARKSNLNTHMKQHTGEKPHTCEVCGEGFIQRHCWRKHMRNYHQQTVF